VNQLFGALAARTLGRTAQATVIADRWQKESTSQVSKWMTAVFQGNPSSMMDSEKELVGASGVSLLGLEKIDQDAALVVEVSRLVQF